jgi:tetratricopeptide (TPR) repeat protein
VGRSALAADAAIVAAVALAYLNALGGSFQFDDYNVIVDNPAVHSLAAWAASMPGIRPLLKLTYALNWTSGLGLLGFHLFNVAVHAANAVLVLRIALCWTQALAPAGAAAWPAAVTVALLFALHPAQTEAVSYISGRSVSLMALFYLSALIAHLKLGDAGGARAWVSPALMAAALAVKETAITLPLVLTLWELAAGRQLREALRATRRHWLVLLGALAAMLATPGYQRLLAVSVDARSVSDNLLSQVDGVWYLITQPLLLLRTNIDPGLPAQHTLSVSLALRALVLCALLIASLLLLRRKPWAGLAGTWMFVHLAPTNSIVPRLDIANDRQLYLALIGPATLLSLALWRWPARRLPFALAGSLVLAVAGATVLRNRDYRDEVALWQATVARAPHNPRAWNNLGFAQHLAGNDAAARASYERALALDPGYDKARFNLDALPAARTADP